MLDFAKTNKWEEMMLDLGVKKEDVGKVDSRYLEEEPFYSRGEKHVEEFVDIMRDEFGLTIDENYSMLADFVSRFDSNPTMPALLKKLDKIYRLGLLTNQYIGTFDAVTSRGLIPPANWEVVVDSSKVGTQKPEDKIFEIAAERAETPVNKILFIDNAQMHVDKEKKLGWNTILYDPLDLGGSNEKIEEFLENSQL